MLPQAFKERMMQLLGDEYDTFIATYDDQDVRGARINTLKINMTCLTMQLTVCWVRLYKKLLNK